MSKHLRELRNTCAAVAGIRNRAVGARTAAQQVRSSVLDEEGDDHSSQGTWMIYPTQAVHVMLVFIVPVLLELPACTVLPEVLPKLVALD